MTSLTDDTSDLPVSVRQGSFKLFGVDVHCHVLSNGERVIEADSMHALLSAMADPGNSTETSEEDLAKFARWQRGLD
jgi:hypothetical protein